MENQLKTNNNNILTSYLNYRFTGTLTPLNEVISSGNILPLTQTEKNLINTIFKSGCYVNVNEKTSPQRFSWKHYSSSAYNRCDQGARGLYLMSRNYWTL